jgi:hypothetical protein
LASGVSGRQFGGGSIVGAFGAAIASPLAPTVSRRARIVGHGGGEVLGPGAGGDEIVMWVGRDGVAGVWFRGLNP